MADSPIKPDRTTGAASMERLVRERAVAPLDPSLPSLPPGERRSWWEFCLDMHEFLGGIIGGRLVNHDQAGQLARLSEVALAEP